MTQVSPEPNKDVVTILADHYQKTYELTLEMWKYRNRTFLYLIGSIGLASLLIFRVPETQGLLVDAIAGILSIQEPSRINDLRNSFPFSIFQSILLVLIFYLMVNLYHRSHYVLRNYQYLSKLESEIRTHLSLPPGSVFFTRESDFYWQDRPLFLGLVKYCYMFIIAGLLSLFFWQRFIVDPSSSPFGLLDFPVAVATVVFYFAYAYSSLRLDSKERIGLGTRITQLLGKNHQ